MRERDLEIVINRMLAELRQDRRAEQRRRNWRMVTIVAATAGVVSALIPVIAALLS